jgi:ribosomal protein S14
MKYEKEGRYKMNCECCGDKKAVTKDFREYGDMLHKFMVCHECLQRSDKSFKAKRVAMLRKKKCLG